MSSGPWTNEENDLIVADYFAMLAEDLAGRRPNKTEHRRALLPLLRNRSEASIEFKHRNISAVLMGLGEVWLRGYRPAVNVQKKLEDAVERWSALHPDWLRRPPDESHAGAAGLQEAAPLWVGPPPTLSNRPLSKQLERMLGIARRFDAAGRDERNRALGRAGEALALAHERAALADAGRDDLAREVRWVSQEEGDGAGYDIASFAPDGRPRLLEVKTTRGWERTPFYISRNELAVSEAKREEWRLFRLWNFSREPKAFELAPPLEAHVCLMPTAFQARFR
ncbi:MAG: DUF3883 domain-containing protein [Alphaproteobacteria bacterium]|nr:DUF3883 domain-containing protein [Alphaproteobacteria bacterium]